MDNSVRDKVIGILAEQAVLAPEQIRLASSPSQLGIDSLGLVEAIFAIEEAFDITVPFNPSEPEKNQFDLTSVSAMIDAVEGLVADQRA